MVGPEGTRNRNESNAVDCQTSKIVAIDSPRLFGEASNQPPPDPGQKKSPAEPASIRGAGLDKLGEAKITPEPPAPQAFDWFRDRADIVVPTQLAIAAYFNPHGAIVIRQERDWNEDDDHIVIVEAKNLPALIAALQRLAGGGR